MYVGLIAEPGAGPGQRMIMREPGREKHRQTDAETDRWTGG